MTVTVFRFQLSVFSCQLSVVSLQLSVFGCRSSVFGLRHIKINFKSRIRCQVGILRLRLILAGFAQRSILALDDIWWRSFTFVHENPMNRELWWSRSSQCSARAFLSAALLACFGDVAHVGRGTNLERAAVLQAGMLRHELYCMIHVPSLED